MTFVPVACRDDEKVFVKFYVMAYAMRVHAQVHRSFLPHGDYHDLLLPPTNIDGHMVFAITTVLLDFRSRGGRRE